MERKLLSGVLPRSASDRDEVLICRRNLLDLIGKEVTFKDEVNNLILRVVIQYFQAAQTIIDLDQFKEVLIDNQIESDKLSKSLIVFGDCAKASISEEKFEFYLKRFIDIREKASFEESLLSALDIIHAPEDFEDVSNMTKAKELLVPQLFKLEMGTSVPQGNIMSEKEEILQEYAEAKKNQGVVGGITTGIKKIDEGIGAIQNGDVCVIAAASGEGKSMMASNIAWWNAVPCRKNVALITAETPKAQYRRRIYTRHSNEPQFGMPLDSTKAKMGSFSPEEEEIFNMVIEDFTSGRYGSLDISQVGNGTKLSEIRVYLEKLLLQKHIDLVIIDYLTLLKPTQPRSSTREEAVELFKEIKNIALSLDKGKGLPIIALHQISTQAREKVKFVPGKYYTLGSLAESSEAAKTADEVIALLRTEEMADEHELGVGILKQRDGDADTKLFKLYEDYAHTLIANLEE